ncbi:MAG: Maf family protein [Deltaproteobacteria bacterium]
MSAASSFVLASRSPRRRELLGWLVPADRIVVVPPRDAAEPGFAGLCELAAIQRRLAEIARQKGADVADQLSMKDARDRGGYIIIAADTTVVAAGADGALRVLGQPPEDDSWKNTVRQWFREYYAGRTHRALTALCVHGPRGRIAERMVSTEVTFIADVESRLEWYIGTEEPRGKAGGYAIQGAGSIFISQVTGSLSNVIGLPLEALLDVLTELQIDVG